MQINGSLCNGCLCCCAGFVWPRCREVSLRAWLPGRTIKHTQWVILPPTKVMNTQVMDGGRWMSACRTPLMDSALTWIIVANPGRERENKESERKWILTKKKEVYWDADTHTHACTGRRGLAVLIAGGWWSGAAACCGSACGVRQPPKSPLCSHVSKRGRRQAYCLTPCACLQATFVNRS